jgi:hypothetical protein
MKAVVSTTYSDTYLFFLPIITWCWNKLGVDVICFSPRLDNPNDKANLVGKTLDENNLRCKRYFFDAPEHKQATYAQCSRLYAACLELKPQEYLWTSDIDMAVFKKPEMNEGFTLTGIDLTPDKQFPICYIGAPVGEWRDIFNLHNKSHQQCLDELLGDIECENMRGNYWGKDQEEAYNKISQSMGWVHGRGRARGDTQFAWDRVDRDDVNWRSYVNDNLLDAHLWRPGFTDDNFFSIIELLMLVYPFENFDWLINYKNEYLKLL